MTSAKTTLWHLPFRHQDIDQYRLRESLPNPIPDFESEMQAYRESSKRARQSLGTAFKTYSYGSGTHEQLDVFKSATPQSPVFLFIHGGAWRMLGREDSAMMAPALHALGITTITIDYGLAPNFSITEMIDQCERALDWVIQHGAEINGDAQNLHISGSSAGAHLAGMVLGRDALRPPTRRRIQSASLLSGVMDLHPIIYSHMNEWLHLNDEKAAELSPVLHLPAPDTRLLVAWGELEPPVMQAQSRHYALQCVNAGVNTRTHIATNRNHYNILMELGDKNSGLFQAVTQMLLL